MLTLHCWLTEAIALQPHSCTHHVVCHTIWQKSQQFSKFNQHVVGYSTITSIIGMESRGSLEFLRSQRCPPPQRHWLRGWAFSPEGPAVRAHWSLWKACLYGYFSLAMAMLLALTSAQRVGYSSLLLQPKQPQHDFSDQIPPLMHTAEAVTALTLLYISVLH